MTLIPTGTLLEPMTPDETEALRAMTAVHMDAPLCCQLSVLISDQGLFSFAVCDTPAYANTGSSQVFQSEYCYTPNVLSGTSWSHVRSSPGDTMRVRREDGSNVHHQQNGTGAGGDRGNEEGKAELDGADDEGND